MVRLSLFPPLSVSCVGTDGCFALVLQLCAASALSNYVVCIFVCLYLQIDKKAMHKAGMVQRVINEVEIQCRLKHPSILEVRYDSPQGFTSVTDAGELC